MGGAGAVFEPAFLHFFPIGVHGRVHGRGRLPDTARRFGLHRGRRRRQRRELGISPFALHASAHRHDPEVVCRVWGEPVEHSRHRDWPRSAARQVDTRHFFFIGGAGAVFERAFRHFFPIGVHGGAHGRGRLPDLARRFGVYRRRDGERGGG